MHWTVCKIVDGALRYEKYLLFGWVHLLAQILDLFLWLKDENRLSSSMWRATSFLNPLQHTWMQWLGSFVSRDGFLQTRMALSLMTIAMRPLVELLLLLMELRFTRRGVCCNIVISSAGLLGSECHR